MTEETRLILEKIDQINQRIDDVNQKIDEKIDGVNQKIDEKIDDVNQKIDEKIEGVNQKIDKVYRKVTSIEVGIETELIERISIVAEGHQDLYRKLDEALKVENEKEMLKIRVNVLEHETRKLKEKTADIA